MIFPPRILAMQDTFRPPWFHRNIASEFMGLVHGAYDAKAEGFSPGGASLHNSMSGHGPDAETFEKASRADLSKPDVIKDTMAFMFETRFVWRPTRQALESAAAAARVLPLLAGPAEALRPEPAMSQRRRHPRPGLESWVESANDPASDFPIQNLPFGRFRRAEDSDWRIGVAIGDQVLDLRAAGLIDISDMNRLMRLLPEARRGAAPGDQRRPAQRQRRRGPLRARRWCRRPRSTMGLPCRIGDYTDFYISIHHATAIGKHLPARQPAAAELQVGADRLPRPGLVDQSRARARFRRPMGSGAGAEGAAPELLPTRRLDYELELGARSSAGRTRRASRSPIERGRGRICSA